MISNRDHFTTMCLFLSFSYRSLPVSPILLAHCGRTCQCKHWGYKILRQISLDFFPRSIVFEEPSETKSARVREAGHCSRADALVYTAQGESVRQGWLAF